MRYLPFLLMLLASTAQASGKEAELPPFPRELHLDPDVDIKVTELNGVPALIMPSEFVATLRARTEWSRKSWLTEMQLRMDVTSAMEKTHERVEAAYISGYEARLELLREHIKKQDKRSLQDAKTIDGLRNPVWYKTRAFAYGSGVVSVFAVGLLFVFAASAT